MKKSESPHHSWEPCHPGMIQEAAQDPLSRRRILLIAGSCIALIVVGVGTLLSVLSDPKKSEVQEMPAGIACITVGDHLIAFVAGHIQDEELKKQIGVHLVNCDSCKSSYDDLRCGKVSGCESRLKSVIVRPCHHNSPAP